MSPEEIDHELRYTVIGCAMQVHTEKGPGLDELVYHETLSSLMNQKTVEHRSRPRVSLVHRGIVADQFEADLLVPDRLILELKVHWGSSPPNDYCQLLSYLKFWRIQTGLLFDFGKERLEFQKVAWTEIEPEADGVETCRKATAVFPHLRDTAEMIQKSLHAIVAQYGLGYRDSTYRGLLVADLLAEGIPCVNQPAVGIKLPGKRLHEERLDCVVVAGKVAVMVTALYERISATAAARLRSYLRHLVLPCGIVVNFGKRRMQVQCVFPPWMRARPADEESDDPWGMT